MDATNSVGLVMKIGIIPVAKIKTLGAPNLVVGSIDTTTLDSVGGFKESIPDFIDPGELNIDGFSISDVGQSALYANLLAKMNTGFTIECPDGSTMSFDGHVSEFSKNKAGVGEALGFSAKIKVSGVVSYSTIASTGLSACAVTQVGGTALTALEVIPAFAIGTYKNVVTFTTQTAYCVKATNATSNTTMELYIDGVYIQDLTTAVESASIAQATAGVKMLTIKVWQTSKSPLYYDIAVAKVS